MRSLALAVFLLPTLSMASECRFTAQRDFDVDAAGLHTLAVALGSSDIKVEGVPGLAKVEVRAKACASDQDWLAGLDVDQQRHGDTLTITPRNQREGSWHWLSSSYAYIDLHVRVPAALAVDIKGSSGDADVAGVAALNFDASSGDLRVNHVAGAVEVGVSSGDVEGGDVGSIDVRHTSSGDIRLRDVRGNVDVAHSGSGDLSFDNVGGGVRIGDVGSGDVRVGHVDGDVSVVSIGSGDVDATSIGRGLSVGSKGSGDVSYHDVRGSVSVPHEDD